MNRFILTIALLLSSVLLCYAGNKNDDFRANYEIEGQGAASTATTIVKVSVTGKKAGDITNDLLKKCAIHGILFRGFVVTQSSSYADAPQQRALMGSPMAEAEHSDYFTAFFDTNAYAGYCQILGESRRVAKVGKQYRVSVNVSVSLAQLRTDLENAGLIKNLSSGW